MEFSISSMKKALQNYSDKRVSRKAAEKLGEQVEKKAGTRSAEARTKAYGNNRKTVRAEDFKNTRTGSVGKVSSIDIPKAPVERIIRNMDAERVSDNATEELKYELLEFIEDTAEDVVAMTDHANRRTIKKEDVELALR